jgi:outer membrane lipoprotein-sorting protein
MAPAGAAPAPDVSADVVLDWLHEVGRGLKDFTADVKLLTIDNDLGNEIGRNGKVFYRAGPDGRDAKIRVSFADREEGRRLYDERVDYALADGWLVERNYASKVQTRRQVMKPGEQVNLLRLGEGPFPLPIGQDKAEVKKLFDVTVVPPQKGDPPDTIRLKLKPRPDSPYARKFEEIGVAVDRQQHMPRRIDAVDPNGVSTRTTHLNNVKVNPGMADDAFKLEPIEGWNERTEEFRE